MSHGPAGKIALLGSLYLAQGLPFGFFTQTLPVLMREEGHSLGSIGLASLLALPWALKFLWAPAVDRFGSSIWGRRRSWIIPLQLLSVGALLFVGLAATPAEMSLLLSAVFIVNLISATQDVATDGLAVDILGERERGLANGVQVAGYRLGMIIGGGVLLVLLSSTGWRGSFLLMAAALSATTIPILLFSEPDVARSAPRRATPGRFRFLRRPDAARILLLVVLYKIGDAFATGMLRPFLSDRGLSLEDVGWLLGTVGFVAGLLGALAGGGLVNRLGRRRALVAFGVLQAASVAAYAHLAGSPGSLAGLYLVCGAEHFASGMATAALFTCMMDWCSRETGATDYTIQSSAVVIATGTASAASGFSAQSLGYPNHFMLACFLAVIAVLAAASLFPRRVSWPSTRLG